MKNDTQPAPVRSFVVKLEVRGSHVDEDTKISEQALVDLFQMQFACPKGLKILRVEAEEKTE